MGAKTYTEYTIAAPTNVSGTVVSGGSLTASTTYYYKVIALSCEGIAINNTNMNCESVPSAEVNFTTDAVNKSITVTWSGVAAADYYAVLRTTVSGNYAYGTAKMLTATALQISVTAPTVTFTDNGARSAYNFRIYKNGLPVVKLEGGSSSDYIDEDWIYTQMTSSGTLGSFVNRISDQSGDYPVAYFFDTSFVVGTDTGNATFLRFNRGKLIVQNGRFQVSYVAAITYDMGTTMGTFGYGGPTYLKIGKTYSSGGDSVFSGNGNIYGTRIIDWVQESGSTLVPEASSAYFGYRNSIGSFINTDYTKLLTLKNCMISAAPMGCTKQGYVALSNNIYLGGIYSVGHPDNLAVSGGYWGIADGLYVYTYASGFGKFEDAVMEYAQYDIAFGGHTTYRTFLFRNTTFYNSPVKAQVASNNEYTRIYDGVTFEITVVDKAGATLSGVSVAIQDVNNYNCAWVYSGCDLNEDISASEVSGILVTDASKLAADDVIMIDLEKMTVATVNGGANEITVTRNAFEDVFQAGNTPHDGASTLAIQPKIYKRVATLTTDGNGQIEKQLWIIKDHYDYNAGGATSYKYTKTTHNPYKITISKAGYESLVLDNITFSEKTKWRVELQDAIKLDLSGKRFEALKEQRLRMI